MKYVFWFSVQLLFETCLILRSIKRYIVINVKIIHVQYPLFLSDFNGLWIFSTDFRKKLKFQVTSKSVQWEPSCSLRTDGRPDGQTWHDDMTKLIVAFRNFANAPKNQLDLRGVDWTGLDSTRLDLTWLDLTWLDLTHIQEFPPCVNTDVCTFSATGRIASVLLEHWDGQGRHARPSWEGCNILLFLAPHLKTWQKCCRHILFSGDWAMSSEHLKS